MQRYLLFFLIGLFVWGCESKKHPASTNRRLFTDVLGRQVSVPDSIRRIIPLNESTMRMVCYVKGADRVCGIEDVELRGVAFTHIFAHPELRRQPMIGPMFGGDPELIMLQHPDVVVVSNLSAAEADEMQGRLKIPVVVISYGNLSSQRQVFFDGLRMTGDLLDHRAEADSLIRFVEHEVAELERLTAGLHARSAYLGGISYRGRHDIVSTDPHYAAFDLVHVPNVARQVDSLLTPSLANLTIDMETLLRWNPEVLFVDQGGFKLVQENFRSFKALSQLLNCYKQQQIYLLWPYYMFHSNFEAMLINAWSVGKVMYPERFASVDLREKADEILGQFVGKAVTDSLIQQWGWFRNVTNEL
ncbi:MAG: ABC transporter substrate-binding protein [Bacteroidales bacterium]